MEKDLIKDFLLNKCPNLLNNYTFNEIYKKYTYYAKTNNKNYVSKNKFSRILKGYGFRTKVIRNQYTGRCERIITISDRILLAWNLTKK